MIIYVDTSVVLRWVLDQQPRLEPQESWEPPCSSELMGVEARRAIDRSRLLGTLDDEAVADAHDALAKVERMMRHIVLDSSILRRASSPMPTKIKTLDALHLASALVLQESQGSSIVFATHDRLQSIAARALGFSVLGAG